jgi:hypothetical protein
MGFQRTGACLGVRSMARGVEIDVTMAMTIQ